MKTLHLSSSLVLSSENVNDKLCLYSPMVDRTPALADVL